MPEEWLSRRGKARTPLEELMPPPPEKPRPTPSRGKESGEGLPDPGLGLLESARFTPTPAVRPFY